MTRPAAKAIEGSTKFTGIQRDWVKAIIAETVASEIAVLKANLLESIEQNKNCSCANLIDEVITRLTKVEERYEEDDKFSLTRAKLLRFMKEQGL